jgi:RHS repeat-associated protein
LSFDPENRMTSYGSLMSSSYRGDGLRASKQSCGNTTYFLYDGIVPVSELNSSSAVIATNTFGANGLVSWRTGSASVFYSFDSEGNVAQRSDSSVNVLSNHLFSAHGVILSGTLNEPFGYKARFGYFTDTETGFQLLTHRYYDSTIGRFLTRDPVGYLGGANLYSYVLNEPVLAVDPQRFNDGFCSSFRSDCFSQVNASQRSFWPRPRMAVRSDAPRPEWVSLARA